MHNAWHVRRGEVDRSGNDNDLRATRDFPAGHKENVGWLDSNDGRTTLHIYREIVDSYTQHK